MKYIDQAANDLLQRLQSTCPACRAPGFWISEWQPGLPCASCRLPTHSYRSEVWTCLRCEHRSIAERRTGQQLTLYIVLTAIRNSLENYL